MSFVELYKKFKYLYKKEPKDNDVFMGERIGFFSDRLRLEFKTGKLSKNIIKILEDVEFSFEIDDTVYDKNTLCDLHWIYKIGLYSRFKREFGREPKYNDVFEKEKIGQWCISQRTAYKKGKLSEKKVNALINARFVFDILWK